MSNIQERYGTGIALAFLLVLALTWLSGCTQYFIRVAESDAGNVTTTITSTPNKTVDTSLGVSAAATAAASQNGEASNSGASESHALGDKP